MRSGTRDLGAGPYPCDTPSRRYPTYTRGNTGEVSAEPVYPLGYSIASRADDLFMNAALASGAVDESDFDEGDEVAYFAAVLGGYTYLNLSLNRVLAVRTPGVDVEDADEAYLGRSEAAPYVRRRTDKRLRATLGILAYILRAIRVRELPELDEDRQRVRRWAATLPDSEAATDEQLAACVTGEHALFFELFERHLDVSARAGLGLGLLRKVCVDRFGEPELAVGLLGGIGEVESAAPSYELWSLGRTIAADPLLGEHFDAGTDGLYARLREDPAAAAFVARFNAFLAAHGARGPNEWELASHTWGTCPDLALALVDRMRVAEDDADPRRAGEHLAHDRRELVALTRARLPWVNRRGFDRALRVATLYTQARERSKTTAVMALQEIRLRARELGRRLGARHRLDPDALFYVTVDELGDFLDDPDAFAGVIATRLATRDELCALVPPFLIDGDIPPVDEWERRDTPRRAEHLAVGESISAIPGCIGSAVGTARVVLSPTDPAALEPGEILIAPHTDPAWTPLFVPAAGVVVDVGAQMSHAVIVSRELGVPCVVSATDATRRIPDGATIRVDGTKGVVELLALPD